MTIPTHDRMRLTITRSTDSAVDYVEILGDVDMSDSVELGHAADHLHAADPSCICVDLGGTTFMDSTLLEFSRVSATAPAAPAGPSSSAGPDRWPDD